MPESGIPITAMALKRFGNDLVTGDSKGVIQYCDETFKYILIIENAHTAAGDGSAGTNILAFIFSLTFSAWT